MLLEVASRTANDKIFGIIRATATEWNNVIYMVLSYFFVTIVAFTMLSLIAPEYPGKYECLPLGS